MAEIHLEPPPPPQPIITRNRALEMYRAYPEMLGWELGAILSEVHSQEDMAIHNVALRKIALLAPHGNLFQDKDRPRLMKALAQTLLNHVRTTDAP